MGDLTQRTKELHDRYGSVVRLAPNELSFVDAQGWQDIYNHHQGRPNFPKNPLWMTPGDNGIHSILSANDADHARYRRLLSHAFSERALREQEYLPLAYIDLLIQRLCEAVSSSKDACTVVDMVQWFNFTTFDIVGDLALGESFNCLEESKYHGWVSILFSQFKVAALFVSLRFFGLDKLLKMVIPTSLLKQRAEHANTANERIHRRLDHGAKSTDAQRHDFMTYVLRHNDEKGMSIPEIEATFKVLVVAGSETTGTALSGIMGYLLQSPDILGNLTKEICQSFHDASAICADRASNLPYLGAVIEEGLRLCPPVALGMPRVVPSSGAEVSGHWLPGGVSPSSRSLHNSHRLLTSNLTIPSDIRILLWLCLQPFES
jgi:cytochrome P450